MESRSLLIVDSLIKIKKEDFDILRTDERFWCLVTLARAVNTFRFCSSALVSTRGNSSSSGVRAQRSSFLFMCALFAEAQILVAKMGRYFRGFETFRKLSQLTNSQVAQTILKSNLRPVRNTQVFHFDPADTGEQLRSGLLPPNPDFLSATGETDDQTYWELGDLCAMLTFLGPDLKAEGLPEMIERRIGSTANLAIDFVIAAEAFLVDALSNRSNWIAA